MQHRRRIQAQGKNLEESESWAQPTPPTVVEGLSMLERLKRKLSFGDAKIREQAFDNAKRYIEQTAENGGVDALVQKKFLVKGTQSERIDIEIISGKAFVK